MGKIYQTIGQERKALEFHQQALEIVEEIRDLELQGSAVRNIGFVRYFLGYYDKAEALFRKAIKLHEQINDEWSVAGEIGNLGLIHFVRGEYDLEIEKYQIEHELESVNILFDAFSINFELVLLVNKELPDDLFHTILKKVNNVPVIWLC